MIRVNLLPRVERRPKKAADAAPTAARERRLPQFAGDPWTLGLGGVGLLVLLAAAFGLWRTGGRAEELQAQIQQEVADSARFASTIELVSTFQARQDTIQQKIEVIRGVDERRYVWPHLLDEISRALPAFTWLRELSSAGGPEGPTFSLQGNAGSTQSLTRFMKNLEDSPFIRDVTLVTSEQVTEQGATFQRFTLEARYEQPDPALLETVPIITID